jgi:hypothetical protein
MGQPWHGLWANRGMAAYGPTVAWPLGQSWHGLWSNRGMAYGSIVHGVWVNCGMDYSSIVAWPLGQSWHGLWSNRGMAYGSIVAWLLRQSWELWGLDYYIFNFEIIDLNNLTYFGAWILIYIFEL